jgi:hypothetical protein
MSQKGMHPGDNEREGRMATNFHSPALQGQKHKEKKLLNDELSKEALLLEKLKDKLMAQSPGTLAKEPCKRAL